MTIKADDIQGRHQSYADIVQGNNISPPGRTAAFDGLCCEIRGLGMEMTLGRIVDSFEVMDDKSCATPSSTHAGAHALPPPKTLEEEYMVSSVDTREEEGVKILEIPAGDYVPVTRPPAAPVITSVTNMRGGLKPRLEVSQEPIIDDIDEADDSTHDLMNSFIEAHSRGGDDEEPPEEELSSAPAETEQDISAMRLSNAIAPRAGQASKTGCCWISRR